MFYISTYNTLYMYNNQFIKIKAIIPHKTQRISGEHFYETNSSVAIDKLPFHCT